MKLALNILFHLLLITWHAYFSAVLIEDLINGHLEGMSLFFLLLRIGVVVIFSVSLWKMTRRRKVSDPV